MDTLRFKPGDRVVVDPNLNINLRYSAMYGPNAGWGKSPSTHMVSLAGQEFEVRAYSHSKKTLKLKGCGDYWTESMLSFADFYDDECYCNSLL